MGGASSCKQCAKLYTQKHRQTPQGKASKRKDNKNRRIKYRERINSYYRLRKHELKWKFVQQLGNKCFDCHQSFPLEVYDFHHLDPTQKEGSVLDLKEKELEKCVLLCSNCHRLRHIKPWGDENV